MTSAVQLLQELNEGGEQTRIEAKTASEVGTSVLETVCAFANEPDLRGGYFLLGVKRTNENLFEPYSAVGVKNAEKLTEDLATQGASVFNRPVRPQIHTESIDGQTVVWVFVTEALVGDKPIFFVKEGLPKGDIWRYGATDQE